MQLHEHILRVIRRHATASAYRVAFSGGADSTALLLAVAELRDELAPAKVSAVHVDHGLQPESADWAAHCRTVCEGLAIECQVLSVDSMAGEGRGPEADARDMRYAALEKVLGADEVLLVAHHRDDQDYINQALEQSLERLQTDYIDLYQLHWPERNTNFFGKLGYPEHREQDFTPFEETLAALDECVRAGKIRHVGLSNETPWGAMRFLDTAGQRGLPRMVSIQNPYSLLNRSFEVGLAEIAHREHLGLLAYSPLGFGVLSGKYLDDRHPAGARLTLYPDYTRYSNEQAVAATRAYVELARDAGLDPARMALAFVNSRPFLTSNIVGATTMEQLESNLASAELELSDDVLAGIEAIHRQYPNPAP